MPTQTSESLETVSYERGRRDGLRIALAVLAIEEEKWAALLGQSQSWLTNTSREVRHKAFQVAQKRVQRELNRLKPKSDAAGRDELTSALEKLGL